MSRVVLVLQVCAFQLGRKLLREHLPVPFPPQSILHERQVVVLARPNGDVGPPRQLLGQHTPPMAWIVEEKGDTCKAMSGDCCLSEVSAERLSNRSEVAPALPRTTMLCPRTVKYTTSPSTRMLDDVI